MGRRYQVGDHVSWNYEAGRVRGRIVKVHVRDFDYKRHRRHASEDERSTRSKRQDRSHRRAQGTALRKLRD